MREIGGIHVSVESASDAGSEQCSLAPVFVNFVNHCGQAF
jgi:hypothetical protein